MLHEILLSLSGHPSPLLRNDAQPTASAGKGAGAVISPPERELLATAAHISDLIIKLQSNAAQISAEHPSTICRAVATAVESIHLDAFQRKVLQVEEGILREDPDLVGAYNIVPLTAVMGEFSEWTRRLEWLWEVVQYIVRGEKTRGDRSAPCRGSQLIDSLRAGLQSGYIDIEETAMSLVAVAETAWLKQVSAWILYGRLPTYGGMDFFIQRFEDETTGQEDYKIASAFLPKFVTEATAQSMLFVGRSLNHVRATGTVDAGLQGLDQLSSQIKELSALTYPLEPASFSRTITGIRRSLSRNILQKLLPLSKILESLELLREFFLLGRGEFAMSLTHQADEKLRSRWKRADNLAYEKREGLGAFAVKEGEVTAVLGKTWAALGLMQGQHAEEDEILELARESLRLHLAKGKPAAPVKIASGPSQQTAPILATTPFHNLLFSVPVDLHMHIPSPLDMFLSPADLQVYTAVNSYLLSLRRAHIRLTDLWKITSLRRHHPSPPAPPGGSTRGGRAKVQLLRQRYAERSSTMRSTWVTASAAIFFLAETEAYLQAEVVAGLWDGFYEWVESTEHGGKTIPGTPGTKRSRSRQGRRAEEVQEAEEEDEDEDDIWLAQSTASKPSAHTTAGGKAQSSTPSSQHDPQSLALAHSRYLAVLAQRLLITCPSYTEPLYVVLVDIDHLVGHVHRLHGIWASMDLEADAGVVDAFVDLETEEAEVKVALRQAEDRVKAGVESVIAALRALEADTAFAEGIDSWTNGGDDEDGGIWGGAGEYVPQRVGGVERLLMKLDFGGWFGRRLEDDDGDDDDHQY